MTKRRGIPTCSQVHKVKRVSGKETMTLREAPDKIDREVEAETKGFYWRDHGRRWRFRYRINYYAKEQNNQA